jgi:hypothetical protein
MIDATDVEELAYGLEKIIHIKTENVYRFVFPTKAKINGEWVKGAVYASDETYSHYWRPYDDFEGFDICEEME